MPRADQATIDLLNDYFQAMEVKDFDRLGAFYAENITQTFANAPTITGRDPMLARMIDLLGKVNSLAHPLINACSVFTIADGKFTDQPIYVDNAPVDRFLS